MRIRGAWSVERGALKCDYAYPQCPSSLMTVLFCAGLVCIQDGLETLYILFIVQRLGTR